MAASLISPWLLWWPPAESHYNIYDHSVVGYVSHAHCIVLLYPVRNKITTTTKCIQELYVFSEGLMPFRHLLLKIGIRWVVYTKLWLPHTTYIPIFRLIGFEVPSHLRNVNLSSKPSCRRYCVLVSNMHNVFNSIQWSLMCEIKNRRRNIDKIKRNMFIHIHAYLVRDTRYRPFWYAIYAYKHVS